MNLRVKIAKFAAYKPAIFTAAAGVMLSAAGCLIDQSAKSPATQPAAPVAVLPSTRPAFELAVKSFRTNIEPILKEHCYDCHTGSENKTPLAFDTQLATDDGIAKNPELWLKVLRNTRSHIMPPPDSDAPTPAQQEALDYWIEHSAFGVDPAHLDPGRQTMRRLNRTEYHNTILDLTGVDFDTDTQFPADDIGYGFDNIGDVLNVSPMLMEKYMQAAQAIIAQAVPQTSRVMPMQTVPGNKFSDSAGAGGGGGRGGRGGGAGGGSLDLSYYNDAKVTHTFNVAIEGDYHLVLDWNIKGAFNFIPSQCTRTYAMDGKDLGTSTLIWHDDFSGSDEFDVHWPVGKHTFTVTIHPTTPKPAADAAVKSPVGADAIAKPLAAADSAPKSPAGADAVSKAPATADATPNAAVVADATPKTTATADATPKPPAGTDVAPKPAASADATPKPPGRGRAGATPRPQVAAGPGALAFRILKTQLQGPLDESKWNPTPGYTRIFPRGPAPTDPLLRQAYMREILSSFATKAFRRPVPAQTVDRLVEIAQGVDEAPGGSFEKGVSQAMVAILASPRFLYRVESNDPTVDSTVDPRGAGGDFAPVDEYSLASRLSYFLWSTMPDDELLKLAAAQQLRSNLKAQVTRMLADARSQEFVQNFTGQWLQSREVNGVAISPRDVMLREGITTPFGQTFPGPVRAAMKQEPEACFNYIMKEDRSVNEFIDADYVFVNQPLADFYKLPPVTGNEMQKIMLPPGDLRGGALTMGATLMVTSNPTRTSPVKRGKWILENILGAPTPPPPPDIPPLESTTIANNKKPTLREILAAHRASPVCASCHDRMDPLGLSMENFNAEGLYRKQELDQPIDASGQLETGEKFENVADVKHALIQNHLPEYYRCLTEKLLIYATGRGMEYYDMPTIDNIVGRLSEQNGRFSALLLGVIESAPFQERRVTSKQPLASGG